MRKGPSGGSARCAPSWRQTVSPASLNLHCAQANERMVDYRWVLVPHACSPFACTTAQFWFCWFTAYRWFIHHLRCFPAPCAVFAVLLPPAALRLPPSPPAPVLGLLNLRSFSSYAWFDRRQRLALVRAAVCLVLRLLLLGSRHDDWLPVCRGSCTVQFYAGA